MNTKNKTPFYYEKLRLTDDYQYKSEEKEQQQTSEKPNKKEPLKKPTRNDVSNSSEWVNRKEAGLNNEIFQKNFKNSVIC